MNEYDKDVLQCFLEKQEQLFPEPVAETEEEAAWFLEDMMAVVVSSAREVVQYFEEAGVDFSKKRFWKHPKCFRSETADI